MKAIDRLVHAIERTGNPSALGLDARYSYLPQVLQAKYPADNGKNSEAIAEALRFFNHSLIDVLCEIVPCVKLQVAYYEMLGVPGMELFRDTLAYAKEKGMVSIADIKRNDIGATAEAYAEAYLAPNAPFSADFVTLNGYLGSDGILPFTKLCEENERGAFILVRTSNPSAGEFQDRVIDGRPLYEHVGEKVAEWGAPLRGDCGYSSVGAVVGATWPEEGKRLRLMLPHTFFLVPGYGAQGASADDLAGCFDEQGGGAIVNASRSLMCAYVKRKTQDFQSAAREEALRMRDDITSALKNRKRG